MGAERAGPSSSTSRLVDVAHPRRCCRCRRARYCLYASSPMPFRLSYMPPPPCALRSSFYEYYTVFPSADCRLLLYQYLAYTRSPLVSDQFDHRSAGRSSGHCFGRKVQNVNRYAVAKQKYVRIFVTKNNRTN